MFNTTILTTVPMRIWVGYFFLAAGLKKAAFGLAAPAWFAGLSYPPILNMIPADINWIMAMGMEVAAGAALIIGFQTRLASIGLLFVTLVAIYTSHFGMGFAGFDNITGGFQVPLMAGVMLVALIGTGGGKFSVDNFIPSRFRL